MTLYPSPVDLVKEFHTTYGQPIRSNPVLNLTDAEVELFSDENGEYVWPGPRFDVPEKAMRHDLIDEEIEELSYALLGPNSDGTPNPDEVVKEGREPWTAPDFVETIDALADIVYVVCGAGLTHGVEFSVERPLPDFSLSFEEGGIAMGNAVVEKFEDLNRQLHSAETVYEMIPVWEDMISLAYNAAGIYGVDLDEILAEVQASNMSKLGADGEVIRREDGKILKGPNFFVPDIKGILEEKGLLAV